MTDGEYKIIRGDQENTFEDKGEFEDTVQLLESGGEEFETVTPDEVPDGLWRCPECDTAEDAPEPPYRCPRCDTPLSPEPIARAYDDTDGELIADLYTREVMAECRDAWWVRVEEL